MFWILTAVGLAALFVKPPASYGISDAIVAVVNDEIITLQDLEAYVNTMYLQLSSTGRSEEEIEKILQSYDKKTVLNQLIQNSLLISAADEMGLAIRPGAVDEQINQIKGQYPTEQAFLAALVEEGLTVTDLRKKFTEQLKAKYVIDFEIREKIFVNPQEVTEFYQNNREKFKNPAKVELGSIFIAYGEDPAAARSQGTAALKAIRDGKAFEEVAAEYSQAPSLGAIEKDMLSPEILQIIDGLKEGEVSSLVETDSGIYILQLKKEYPGEIASLEEARGNIYNHLFQQKFRAKLDSWLKELRAKAYIEIKD